MEHVKKKHHQTLVFILFLIILSSLTSKSGSSSPESSQNRKHHFVLVHGACHGAWSWYKVITLLKSWGHNVTALDLAASGVNQKQVLELRSISEYFEPLTEFMTSSVGEDERVVLVGHSLGGLAISHAMEHFPHKISVAVFVTAFMPGPTANISAMYQMAFSNSGSLLDNHYTYDEGRNKPATTFAFGPHYLASRLYQLSSKQAVCCFNPPSFSLITPFYPLLCFLCHRRTFYFFRHDHSSNPSQETGSLRSAANWVNSPWKLFWSHQELGCTSEIERQRTRSWNSCLKIFGRH